jgi:hypothetical protein
MPRKIYSTNFRFAEDIVDGRNGALELAYWGARTGGEESAPAAKSPQGAVKRADWYRRNIIGRTQRDGTPI